MGGKTALSVWLTRWHSIARAIYCFSSGWRLVLKYRFTLKSIGHTIVEALLVAIPDADLIYEDTAETEDVPITRLWRLPIDTPSNRELLGSLRSSFFGLPRWSDNRAAMVYLQRVPQSNRFTIYTADMTGENALEILEGEAGTIELPAWIPGSEQFVYSLDEPGRVFVGSAGAEGELLTEEVVFAPKFVTNDLYVFATTAAVAADGIQMRYARIGERSQAIGGSGGYYTYF